MGCQPQAQTCSALLAAFHGAVLMVDMTLTGSLGCRSPQGHAGVGPILDQHTVVLRTPKRQQERTVSFMYAQ
jgi:hypothetical protein